MAAGHDFRRRSSWRLPGWWEASTPRIEVSPCSRRACLHWAVMHLRCTCIGNGAHGWQMVADGVEKEFLVCLGPTCIHRSLVWATCVAVASLSTCLGWARKEKLLFGPLPCLIELPCSSFDPSIPPFRKISHTFWHWKYHPNPGTSRRTQAKKSWIPFL